MEVVLATKEEGLASGERDQNRHRVRVRLHCGEQGSTARAGLYRLTVDVTVSSHSGHPTWGCTPRGHRRMVLHRKRKGGEALPRKKHCGQVHGVS